jgi:hypothetical protein
MLLISSLLLSSLAYSVPVTAPISPVDQTGSNTCFVRPDGIETLLNESINSSDVSTRCATVTDKWVGNSSYRLKTSMFTCPDGEAITGGSGKSNDSRIYGLQFQCASRTTSQFLGNADGYSDEIVHFGGNLSKIEFLIEDGTLAGMVFNGNKDSYVGGRKGNFSHTFAAPKGCFINSFTVKNDMEMIAAIQFKYFCPNAQLKFPIMGVPVKLNENSVLNASVGINCTASDNICACSMNSGHVSCDNPFNTHVEDEKCFVNVDSLESCSVRPTVFQIQHGTNFTLFESVPAQCTVSAGGKCSCNLNYNQSTCSGEANAVFGVCSLQLTSKTSCELARTTNVVLKAGIFPGYETSVWSGSYYFSVMDNSYANTSILRCSASTSSHGCKCTMTQDTVSKTRDSSTAFECGGVANKKDGACYVQLSLDQESKCRTLESPDNSQVFEIKN